MSILDNNRVKNKCQRFTPLETVIDMLQMAHYEVTSSIIGKKFLDNSFGSGNILAEAVECYIKACEISGYSPPEISTMLHRDIYGIELDDELYRQCSIRLDAIAESHHLPKVAWNLYHADALRWETEERLCLSRFRPSDGTPLDAEFLAAGRTVLYCRFME